ncbi:molybdate ABC transporter substrate-binding protein [Shimia sp. NS0008-38b]|uniref:molybdate ABC transporter substrate-binding protein n=1 Tax=Shimia sp. NS0008-38b TaxID=3127653 RepID=UPI00310690A1
MSWSPMSSKSPLVALKVAVTAVVIGCGAATAQAGEVVVFAAASLKEALEEVAAVFEVETGHEVVLSFAGSSALARQIEYGAPADVFVSANVAWMTHLRGRGLLDKTRQKISYGNSLALVVPERSTTKFRGFESLKSTAFLSGGRMAMALTEAVPAGIYGRQALEALGVWAEVAPFVAQVDNVRAALALVALGEAQAGVVYVTDAAAENRVRTLGVFPEETHDDIVYPVAMVQGRDRPEVLEFMEFWDGSLARAAFQSRGFRVLESR